MANKMVELANLSKKSPVNAAPAASMDVDDFDDAASTSSRNGEDLSSRSDLDSRKRILRTSSTKHYIHPTMYECSGIIINFINHAGSDMCSVIGGVRLSISEIAQLPEYLVANEGKVKTHAVSQLQTHLVRCQSALGLNEKLTLDDFSLTFTIASITEEAALLNPNSRSEGPMWMCHFPSFTRMIQLDSTPGEEDYAYVVNGYINLVHQNQRRRLVAQKHQVQALKIAQAAAYAEKEKKEKEMKEWVAKTEKTNTNGSSQPPRKTSRTKSPARNKKTFVHPTKLKEEVNELRKDLHALKAQTGEKPPAVKPAPKLDDKDDFPSRQPEEDAPFWTKDSLPAL